MSSFIDKISKALNPLFTTLEKMWENPPQIIYEISVMVIRMLMLGAILLLVILCIQLVLNIVRRRIRHIITIAVTLCVITGGLFFAYSPRAVPLPKLEVDSGYILKGDGSSIPLTQDNINEMLSVLNGKMARMTLATKQPKSKAGDESHLKLVLLSATEEINVNAYEDEVYYDKNVSRSLLLRLVPDEGEVYKAILQMAQ